MPRREDDDVIRFDFDMNYTLEVDGDTWRDLLEVHEGSVPEAIAELGDEMESDLQEETTSSGRAWPCFVSKDLSVVEDLTKKEVKT